MFKNKAVTRSLGILTASTALLLGSAGIASAADTYNYLSDIDGHSVGYMKHNDEEPDSFTICDTQSDGYGVTGAVYIYQGVWARVGPVLTDGGDAGCDTTPIEITNPWDYKMEICWNGPGNICHTQKFEE